LQSENKKISTGPQEPAAVEATPQSPGEIASSIQRLSESARPPTVARTAEEVRRVLGDASIEAIYREAILPDRTRQYEIITPPNPRAIEIIHTLLGIELKIGNRRLLCPDLATARYLTVFARLGCQTVAVPYDITRISRLADVLDSSWHRTMLIIGLLTEDRSLRFQNLVRRLVISSTKTEITSAGSGPAYPEFKRPARRQSKSSRV
jgi:hypothetical protein